MLVFLFTDIEDSTRLWEEHTGAMGAVIERHDAILQKQVNASGGRITKHTGDGITAAFEGGEPLACALETQTRFGREAWGAIGELRIRVGLHAGEAEWLGASGRPGGDYFGPPVNTTARVMSAAWGGQILLTPEVTQASTLPDQATLLDLGQNLLKNVSAPQQLYQLLHPRLPRLQFPPPRTLSGQSIRKAVDQRGRQLAGLDPARMGVALLVTTLLPALQGELDPESGALEGNLGVLEELGALSLRGFVARFAERLRAGEPMPATELQVLLQAELRAEWQAGGETALTLRSDASHLLQAVHGVEAAMLAASAEVKEALARGLTGLASQFDEFRWVLGDVQETLAEVRGLQRQQLDLQQVQLARTEELLALHREPGRPSLPTAPEAPAVEPQRPAFLEAGAPDLGHRPVFVARERELAWLQGRLDAALEGQGRAVFVTGGPGRGKTALLEAFARQAMDEHDELLVASGTCNAYSGLGDPYLPFREVLGMLSGEVEAHWAAGAISRDHALHLWQALPAAVEALLAHGPHVVPALVPGEALLARASAAGPGEPWLARLREQVARGPGAAGGLEQSHLFQQVGNVLQALSQVHPLLLILDDLQWVDRASTGLLFHLGRRLEGARILIVGAYRPEEVALGREGARPGERERHPLEKILSEFKRRYGRVWVDLAEVEGRGFVDAWLDTEPNRLGQDFRRALFAHTAGHPMFTVELLRALQERGNLIQDAEGRWIAGPALDWQTLPARVEAVIEERIGRLDEELRDILIVAGVEGQDFTVQVVARVQEIGERRLLKALSQELERRHGLVREEGSVAVGARRLTRYRFSHALFQQYLYQNLSNGERGWLHREIGLALEELYRGYTEEIAVQLVRHFADDPEREWTYAKMAGERAAEHYANEEAVRYLSHALELAPETADAKRYALLLARERVYGLLGERKLQARDLAALQALADALSDPRMRAEASFRQSDYARMTSDYQAAATAARQGVALAQETGDAEEEARGHLAWGQALMRQGDYDATTEHLSRTLDLARAVGSARLVAAAVRLQGVVAFYQGDQPGARRSFEQALSAARESGSRRSEASALNNLGAVAGDQGDLSSARGYFEQTLAIMREIGDRIGEGLALNNLGVVARDMGDYAAARAYLEQALAIYVEILHRQGEVYILNDLASVARAQADYAGARDYYEQSLAIARDIGDRRGEAYALTGLGDCLAELGQWAEAAAACQQAVGLRQELHQPHLEMESRAGSARAALAQGDLAQAQGDIAAILAYLDAGNSLDGTDEPLRIYLTCYQVLQANGDERAEEILVTAHRALQERAARLADERARRAFLEGVPWHREIVRAYSERGHAAEGTGGGAGRGAGGL